VARDKLEHGGLEETRTIVKTDRRLGFEAQRVVFRIQMKIVGQNRNIGASERLAGEEFPQGDGQFGHNGERLCALDLMSKYRPGSGPQAEGDLPPVRELGYRREGHS
jgi:hypothetical protein